MTKRRWPAVIAWMLARPVLVSWGKLDRVEGKHVEFYMLFGDMMIIRWSSSYDDYHIIIIIYDKKEVTSSYCLNGWPASWTDWRANMSPQSNTFWLLYLQNVYAVHIGNFTTIFGYNQSMLMINIWNGVHNTLLSGKYPLFIFSDMEVMILHICQIDTFYYEASCSTKLESKHAKTLLL